MIPVRNAGSFAPKKPGQRQHEAKLPASPSMSVAMKQAQKVQMEAGTSIPQDVGIFQGVWNLPGYQNSMPGGAQFANGCGL